MEKWEGSLYPPNQALQQTTKEEQWLCVSTRGREKVKQDLRSILKLQIAFKDYWRPEGGDSNGICEKWIAPPCCDYFNSSSSDKHRLDCEKAMCAEKPWRVSLRHVQIFWWLKGTQIRIMYYIAIFKQLALGALKCLARYCCSRMCLPLSLCVHCNYPYLGF